MIKKYVKNVAKMVQHTDFYIDWFPTWQALELFPMIFMSSLNSLFFNWPYEEFVLSSLVHKKMTF